MLRDTYIKDDFAYVVKINITYDSSLKMPI